MILWSEDFLKRLNSLLMHVITVGRAEIDSTWGGFVTSEYTRLYYVIDGGCKISGSFGEQLFTGGNWYLVPAGCSYRYECPDRMDHVYFHLKLCHENGVDRLRCFSAPVCIKSGNGIIPTDLLTARLTDAIMLRSCLTKIVALAMIEQNITITETRFSPCVESAIDYIKKRLSVAVSVPEIAKYCYVSTSCIAKRFRRELNISVGEYVDNVVMQEAERLLTTTTRSILDISEKLGFSDQFYFSRKFKKKYGTTPMEFRNRQGI